MLVFCFLMGWVLPETQKMELPEVRFSLTFPEPWVVQPGPFREPLVCMAELPPRRGLVMVTRRETGIATQEALMRDFLGALGAQFETHEILENTKKDLTAEVRARRFHIKGAARGNALRNVTYMFTAFEQTYMITLSCKEESFAELLPVFTSVMKTMTFDGPAGYERTQKFLKALTADTIDYADLEAQLKEGANIDGRDMDRLTAMHLAVFKQDPKLVKWLLDHGAVPAIEEENLFRMAGTPAIVQLLKHYKEKRTGVKEPLRTLQAKGMELVWTSPEAQLYKGIKEPIPAYVEEAIANGADLNKPDKAFDMAALPMIRWIIAELEELGLDASAYKPVETILVEAAAKQENKPM